jgi:hypothetical protein
MPQNHFSAPILWDVAIGEAPSFAVLFPGKGSAGHVLVRFALLGKAVDLDEATRLARELMVALAARREELFTDPPPVVNRHMAMTLGRGRT